VLTSTHRALGVVLLSDAVAQLPSLAGLLHNVHVLIILKHIHQADDVEAARQPPQHLHLPLDAVNVPGLLLVR
jgi:hypothetical protein